MRKTKILVSILSLVLVLSFITSCDLLGAKDKTFTKEGMSITLTSDFAENDVLSQTACYLSLKYGVLALKESFQTFKDAGLSTDIDTEAYAALVETNNKITAENKVTENGKTHFEYNKSADGKDFTYYAVCYKSNDAFWLIQFYSETKNFSDAKSNFVKWSNSVTFE